MPSIHDSIVDRLLGRNGPLGGVPAGNLNLDLVHNFVTAQALPSWLESYGTTAPTFTTLAAGEATGTFPTPATVSADVGVRTTFDIELRYQRAVVLTLDGVRWDATDATKANPYMAIDSISGGTLGGQALMDDNTGVKLRANRSSANGGITDLLLPGDNMMVVPGYKSYTLAFIGRRNKANVGGNDGELHFYEGDSLLAARRTLGTWSTQSGPARARFGTITKEAVAHSMGFQQLRLTVVHP